MFGVLCVLVCVCRVVYDVWCMLVVAV